MGRLFRLLQGNSFSPRSISGLALWLDATDIGSFTFNSGDVSAWADKSGNGNNAAQATGSLQPLYVASAINGKPAVQFRDDGTPKLLSVPDHATLDYTTMSCFVVFQRIVDLGATETLIGKFSTGSPSNQREWNITIANGPDRAQTVLSTDGTATTIQETTVVSTGESHIVDVFFDGTNAKICIDNAGEGSGAQASVFNGTSPLHIGARDGATNPYAGYVGEVLFYRPVLSAGQRLTVLRYLAQKWGVTLA